MHHVGMDAFALTALIIGLAIAVFLGTTTLLAVFLGAALSNRDQRESLLGPMMVEDVLEDELRQVYLAARLIEAESEQIRFARELRRYVIEVQAIRCETGYRLALDPRVREWAVRGPASPTEALELVQGLRRDLLRDLPHGDVRADHRLDSDAV